ncbi:MAG: biopolymer transporter ExbD [Candidatus Hydrogenedentes bacterium]|nr:biopolymer transporter ExbD [Candidatus Hydrogenedentota bacterium]
MKFRPAVEEKRKVRASLDLTPLIDVVFNLIIFFMLSSTFVVQSSIQIETPVAEGSESLEQKDVSITLQFGEGGPDGEGRVYLDNEEILDWGDLSTRLSEVMTANPKAMLLIRPDARIETGRLVRVLGIATSVGVERYGIAAEPPTDEK